MKPRVILCAGGGGVGKTTTSAALAWALAQEGFKTLIVTVDPARRLAQAMGVELGPSPQRVSLSVKGPEEGTAGELYALMPEPRASLRTFAEILFENEPAALERMLENRAYKTMGDALSGIHELVSLMLLARATEERDYDVIVVDTAPSRHALNFIAYPGRVASLFEGRAVSWFGNMAEKAQEQQKDEVPQDDSGLLAWGKKRVEAAVSRVLDPRTMRDIAGLFSELALVRERFAELARTSEGLLLGSESRYLLVTAPTGSGSADLVFLYDKLRKLKQRPSGVLLNRGDEALPGFLTELAKAQSITLPVEAAVKQLSREWEMRIERADAIGKQLAREVRGATVIRLPTIENRKPQEIVRALSKLMSPVISLVGRPSMAGPGQPS